MKKKIVGVFALVCALVCALAFFGCGDPENSGVEGSGKITADTDPAKIISQKLSEDQWKEAFSAETYANFSVKETSTIAINGMTMTISGISNVDGNKMHYKATTSAGGAGTPITEIYMSLDNGIATILMYDPSGQKWSKDEQDMDEHIGSDYSSLMSTSYGFFDKHYADFTYDDAAKAYTAAGVTVTAADIADKGLIVPDYASLTYKDITLKFVDGKVGYVKYSEQNEISGGDMAITQTITTEQIFYDYGTTAAITLPAVTE